MMTTLSFAKEIASMPEAMNLIKSAAYMKAGISVVPIAACRDVARILGVTLRDVEIVALKGGICPLRYERSVGTFGLSGQASILEARVAVAGCGGLGGWVIEMLARAGVGEIAMADPDVFDENNLNRQLLCVEGNLGKPKADAAAVRVRLVNGAVTPFPFQICVDAANAVGFIGGASVVIDALDNNRGRRDLFSACRELGVPFVHGAIGGTCGQVGVLRTGDRPLWERDGVPDRGEERTLGNPPFIPPLVAALQVSEALKIITGTETSRGEILWLDTADYVFQRIKL